MGTDILGLVNDSLNFRQIVDIKSLGHHFDKNAKCIGIAAIIKPFFNCDMVKLKGFQCSFEGAERSFVAVNADTGLNYIAPDRFGPCLIPNVNR